MTSAEFKDHLALVAQRWEQALGFAGFDAAIVTAGEPKRHFLDDQGPAFKANPHFLQWCPSEHAAGSALLIEPGAQPRLYFLQPDDYWHQAPTVPEWASEFEVTVLADGEALYREIGRMALQVGNHIALVGESQQEGFQPQDVNPTLLLNHLHFDRAAKTAFELSCMREATRRAVDGHTAAKAAFDAGESEFGINHAYLAASSHLASELPYPNIVALNEHAGVLHYQHYDREAPTRRSSFLIDAGGSHLGYAADITRSYAADEKSLFAELIERMDNAQRSLIETMAPGCAYLDLHIDMHRRLAEILTETGIVNGTADTVFDSGLTETFLPHGLGHLIGLQTHDVGGQQASREGGQLAPPDNYPALRMTRCMALEMPVTIEPGLYFIPQLLQAARDARHGKLLDWNLIEQLTPCGGIRIEDNVVMHADGTENLTRDAFGRI